MAVSIALLPRPERTAIIDSLTPEQQAGLFYDWEGFWARPKQLPPSGLWRNWYLKTGRGFGKTRTGAEWVRKHAEAGTHEHIALVAATSADARDVMVEGESGLLAIAPPWNRPIYEPSKRRVVWGNGVKATMYSAEEPDRLRGPQHALAWCDELCAWARAEDTWDNLMFGLRIGPHPQVCITSTPRPIPLSKRIQVDPETVTVLGSSYENRANLAPSFIAHIQDRYAGTRLGRQEIEGEDLEDAPGALWNRALIEANRWHADKCGVHPTFHAEDFARIVVGVDPTGSVTNECGIVAAGLGVDGLGYVIADTSCLGKPEVWARRAVITYHSLMADRIYGERNYGGDMVESTIRTVDPDVSYEDVVATRGKQVRAEPVAALSEQSRIKFLGTFPALEDELCNWEPGAGMRSPNRYDAFVWAITALMLDKAGTPNVYTL